MLCSLTLYAALKKKYPDSHITLVAAKTNYEIPFFEINPHINRVLVYDKSSLKTILHFYRLLRDRKYSYGFVPSTIALSRTSHIINFLSGAVKRVGVRSIDGFKNKSGYLLNIKDDFKWRGKHQLIRNLEIARLEGFNLSEDEIKQIRFSFTKEEINFANNFFDENFTDNSRKVVAFHPGAGKVANTYPSEKFIQLIKKIYREFNNYILITSGWTDEITINKITSELEKESINFKVVHNLPVKKLGAILHKVNLYVTNDTGTMHIAGFSDAKMISLFGPTDPNEWAPLGKHQYSIKSPTGKIEDLPVDEVLLFAKKFLLGKDQDI